MQQSLPSLSDGLGLAPPPSFVADFSVFDQAPQDSFQADFSQWQPSAPTLNPHAQPLVPVATQNHTPDPFASLAGFAHPATQLQQQPQQQQQQQPPSGVWNVSSDWH